jgi:hypothetical protein
MTITLLWLLAVLGPQASHPGAPEHFALSASFKAPAKPGELGAVAVTFAPKDPDVVLNEEPAPRLKLDPTQTRLLDKQPPPPARIPPFDPETARYLDTMFPVSFPVAWAGKPPASPETLKADVVYFYCSKREGWCRKGSAPVEFKVP